MSKETLVLHDQEWAKTLEVEYEDYMFACADAVDSDDGALWSETTLSGEPFCGCSTCYTREQLFFLVPRIISAFKEGKISIEE